MLQSNNIILAAVGATVNERYKRLVNFTIPISIQPYNFIVAKPKELSRLFLFTAPFTYDVSLSILNYLNQMCILFLDLAMFDYHSRFDCPVTVHRS